MKKLIQSYTGMALPFLLTVTLLFFAVWNSWKAEGQVAGAAKQRAILNDHITDFSRLLSALKDMETGQRGFLITGEEEYLDPYNSGSEEAEKSRAKIEDWIRDEPELQDLWRKIGESIELKQSELAIAIEIRRGQGIAAAQNTVRNEVGKLLMDDIRQNIGSIINRFDKLRYRYNVETAQSIRRSTRSVNFLALAAAAIGFAGVVTVFFAMKAKSSAQQMEMEKRRAERADREKSKFLASMSHEIRTPLNAMLGFSELLEDEVEGGRGKKYLHAIRTSGEGLANLINDILDLSKIESGFLELEFEPVVLAEFARSIEIMFSQKAMEVGVGFEVKVDEACPDFLILDPLRIRQIVTNLVGNALKFTDSGAIAVTFSHEAIPKVEASVNLKIAVVDSGRGIPKDKLKEIFEPFKQVTAKDEVKGGTGLGLSICRQLAMLMNGEVKVKSKPGVGSTFTVTLRNVEVATRPKTVTTGLSRDFNFEIFKPSKILVVDDNPFNRELVAGYLHGTKHTIYFASNGREGVEQARRIVPDVVLMDIRMPVMDGREAFQKIKDDPDDSISEIPVLAVTASSLLQQERILRKDFDGYLRKPFSRLQLVQVLDGLLPRDENPAEPELDYLDVNEEEKEGNPANWAKSVGILRRWERERFDELQATMALGEVVQFARDLGGVGEETKCTMLKRYARDLEDHAASFEMTATEELLNRFHALVDRIERLSVSEPDLS